MAERTYWCVIETCPVCCESDTKMADSIAQAMVSALKVASALTLERPQQRT